MRKDGGIGGRGGKGGVLVRGGSMGGRTGKGRDRGIRGSIKEVMKGGVGIEEEGMGIAQKDALIVGRVGISQENVLNVEMC